MTLVVRGYLTVVGLSAAIFCFETNRNPKYMKTYTELEEIGIVTIFKDENVLIVITKGGMMWKYVPTLKLFVPKQKIL